MLEKALLFYLEMIDSWIWGLPLIMLLVGTGLFLTIRLAGLQFRYLIYALKLAFFYKDKSSEGDISHFQALMTALAATIGIGNIVGVATAVATGGLGAIFWMWVTALLGMATKYAEAILAIKYRVADKKGEMCGGPMYYLERGAGFKKLAVMFALFGAIAAIGTGNMVQAHSVADAIHNLFGVSPWKTGLVLSICTGLVLLGGIKFIGRVTSLMVPLMALLYTFLGLGVIFYYFDRVPAALYNIFSSAFTGQAASGGFIGSSILLAVRMGVSRGIFSNEAGLGSAPIVAAAAKTDLPGRQAMVSMVGTFCDTLVVCSITGLVIAVTGVLGQYDQFGKVLDGAPMTVAAFDSAIPGGKYVVTIGIILFAYSTILGWAYYGEKCTQYLFGLRSIMIYRVFFTFLILPGSAIGLKVIWALADISNALMAIPNLLGILALSSVVISETRVFLDVVQRERND